MDPSESRRRESRRIGAGNFPDETRIEEICVTAPKCEFP